MHPAARLVCDDGLLGGQWEIAFPATTQVDITIKGVGDLVPSWESKLGLQGPDFINRMVYPQLQVEVDQNDLVHFDRDISGIYTLLDKCGTSNSALHKKVATMEDISQPPLFMLIDPTRCGKFEDDSFVFSTSIRRYEYGETRPIVARLHSSWRQSDDTEKTVTCIIPQQFAAASNVQLKVKSIS